MEATLPAAMQWPALLFRATASVLTVLVVLAASLLLLSNSADLRALLRCAPLRGRWSGVRLLRGASARSRGRVRRSISACRCRRPGLAVADLGRVPDPGRARHFAAIARSLGGASRASR